MGMDPPPALCLDLPFSSTLAIPMPVPHLLKEPYKIFQTMQFPGSELYLIVELFRIRTSAPKAVVCPVLPDSYKTAHEVAAVGILSCYLG